MKKICCTLCLLACMWFGFAQTDVEILFHNSSSLNFTVSDAGKIYFNNGYLLIDEGTGTPFSFLVSDIKKMMFDHVTSVETIETPNFRIYPNPATSYIRISNDQNTDIPYQLFALDGRLVLSGLAHSDEPISLIALPNGLYLLKIDDKTFKISKL